MQELLEVLTHGSPALCVVELENVRRIKVKNLSKKHLKHMAKRALFQMDPYNPIIRDIRKWENMNPKFARRERWRFYYAYFNIVWNKSKKATKENDIYGVRLSNLRI